MTRVEEAVEINVPVHSAYNQWTQFEQFPRFMDGVREVRQVDDAHLHWVGDCDGKPVEWDTELMQQVPDEVIAWRSTTGAANTGSVRFMPLDDGRTRVRLEMATESPRDGHGTPEDLNMLSQRVRQDLQRFKQLVESQGGESGAWRGEIAGGQVVGQAGDRSDNDGQRIAGNGNHDIGGLTDGMAGMSGPADDASQAPARRPAAGSAPWLPHLSSMWEEPFSVMRRMTEEMERAMERFIGRAPMLAGSTLPQWTPAVEVDQQGQQLLISADLPGLSKADVRVEVRGDKLIIEGQRQENLQSGDAGMRRTERRFGRFYRMIALPHGADAEAAQASMQDGVLQIRMPVADLQTQGRSIRVEEGRRASPALGHGDAGQAAQGGLHVTQGEQAGLTGQSEQSGQSGQSGHSGQSAQAAP